MSTSDDNPKGFRVSDRRAFTEGTGEPQGGAPDPGDTTTPASPPNAKPASPPSAAASSAASEPARALPPVDFQTLVISLGSSALLQLGEVEDPQTGRAERDLVMAKHTIDVLAMLQEKTQGNLTPPEERLLQSLLFDLRLRFVEASKV